MFHLDLLHFQRNVSNVFNLLKTVCRRHIFDVIPSFITPTCTMHAQGKYHAVCDFRLHYTHTEKWEGQRTRNIRKLKWHMMQTPNGNEKSEIFFNKLLMLWHGYSTKDMNDIFQVHWKQNTAYAYIRAWIKQNVDHRKGITGEKESSGRERTEVVSEIDR